MQAQRQAGQGGRAVPEKGTRSSTVTTSTPFRRVRSSGGSGTRTRSRGGTGVTIQARDPSRSFILFPELHAGSREGYGSSDLTRLMVHAVDQNPGRLAVLLHALHLGQRGGDAGVRRVAARVTERVPCMPPYPRMTPLPGKRPVRLLLLHPALPKRCRRDLWSHRSTSHLLRCPRGLLEGRRCRIYRRCRCQGGIGAVMPVVGRHGSWGHGPHLWSRRRRLI